VLAINIAINTVTSSTLKSLEITVFTIIKSGPAFAPLGTTPSGARSLETLAIKFGEYRRATPDDH
jgi:hypothetical protein